MNRIILIVAVSTLALVVRGQSGFSLQFEIGFNKLTGIANDTLVNHGYAGATHAAVSKVFVSPSLRFRQSLGSKFSTEIGLGYMAMNYPVTLYDTNIFFQPEKIQL